jgi:hypothetical protein
VPRTQLLRGLALLATGRATTATADLLLELLGRALQVLEEILDLGDTVRQAQDGISDRLDDSVSGSGGGRGGNGRGRRHLIVLIYLVGVFLNRIINALNAITQ